jgi:DNA-binding beta-propeller fold protein YncE
MVSRLVGRRLRSRPVGLIAAVVGVAMFAPATASAAPKDAFVADYGSNTMAQYTFSTGNSLTPNGSAPAGSVPWNQAITPNGKYLYVANFYGADISQYSISASGTLTPLTPATVASGNDPYQIAVSPDGRNVYVANFSSGSVDVYDIASDGTLTLAQTETTDLSEPAGLAVSPDGSSVYVGDSGNREIVEFNRASDGSLTPKSPATVASDFSGVGGVVVSPDGSSVYTASDSNSTIDEYNVGSGGELTPKATPSVSAPSGGSFYSLTISPDGKSVYAPDYSNSVVDQFDVGSGGELSPKSTPTVAGGSGSIDLWMTADGKNAYVTNYNADTISQYDVSSGGDLTPKSTPTVFGGTQPISILIPPDQGPVAAFTDMPGKAGKPTSFNGSGSSDSDGSVVRYDWSFGDGTTAPNGGATPSHTYAKAGTYTVTLTVTDDSGCSIAQVFTGQTAYCNGTPAARTTHTVKIVSAAKPKLKLAVSPGTARAGKTTCFAFTVSSKGHRVRKATVKLAGHSTRTSGKGTAKLCLKLRKGTYRARATKKGFASAATRIRITAAAPVFTG